ncbi:MAG: ABATE domain-containing protein [Candidatus Korobacteraceae bacterium]
MSAEQRPQQFQFDLSGGHVALDFANSISRRDSPEKTVEHLTSYHELIAFALQSNLIARQEADALAHEAHAQKRNAAQTLRKAIAFREAIFRVFAHLAAGGSAPAEALSSVEETATESLTHRHIVRANGGYQWAWDEAPKLERILWPIASSAVDLLVSPELHQLRECEAGDCYWLFLDNSRNRSRRWCSMSSCGNREKARRHYRRQHHS